MSTIKGRIKDGKRASFEESRYELGRDIAIKYLRNINVGVKSYEDCVSCIEGIIDDVNVYDGIKDIFNEYYSGELTI